MRSFTKVEGTSFGNFHLHWNEQNISDIGPWEKREASMKSERMHNLSTEDVLLAIFAVNTLREPDPGLQPPIEMVVGDECLKRAQDRETGNRGSVNK